jgi:hypothetical protein
MKKLIIAILLITILTGYQYTTKAVTPDKNPRATIEGNQNDLVYHDYGTGIKLYTNSKLIIKQLNLNLEDESASIYIINLENNEAFKLYDYQPNNDVSYIPECDGVYNIVAKISSGYIIDLTPKAIVENSFYDDKTNGFILFI